MKDEFVKDGYCIRKEMMTFESKKCQNKLPKSFWETYSSFANTRGGTIVLGFEEEGDRLRLNGVENPDSVVKELWDLLHDRTKVSANLLTENDVEVREYGDLYYIVVRIPRADRHQRPVYINGDLDNGTYRRNSEGDYHCTVPEILEMGRDATDAFTDQRIVEKSGIQDINLDTLNGYRNLLRSNTPTHPWLEESDVEFLRLIGAAEIEEGEFRLTMAGLLMFGNDYRITRTIPDYHLDYRRYERGEEWADRYNSDSGLWSGNIFDFYMGVSNRIMNSSDHPFILNGDRRIDDNGIIKAQREMVLNGLVHADYLGKGGIVIVSRGDSLTVRNPGNFRIPPEKAAKGGYSDARNPTLMKMFTLVGFVERSGSGIYRIFRTCRIMGLPLPEIGEEYDPSCVVFRIGLKGSDRLDSKLMQLMVQNEKIGISEMAEFLSVSKSTVSREITRMKTDGKISRLGGTKGRWVVNGSYVGDDPEQSVIL